MPCCSNKMSPQQQLTAAIQFGGDPVELQRVLTLFSFQPAELRSALETLARRGTPEEHTRACIALLKERIRAQ